MSTLVRYWGEIWVFSDDELFQNQIFGRICVDVLAGVAMTKQVNREMFNMEYSLPVCELFTSFVSIFHSSSRFHKLHYIIL